MFVYSLYSYLDVPNAVKESITNSMFKITLNVHILLDSNGEGTRSHDGISIHCSNAAILV